MKINYNIRRKHLSSRLDFFDTDFVKLISLTGGFIRILAGRNVIVVSFL